MPLDHTAILLQKARHAARHAARVPVEKQEEYLKTRGRALKAALVISAKNGDTERAYDVLEKLITLRARLAALAVKQEFYRETEILDRYAADCARLVRAAERLLVSSQSSGQSS